MGSTIAEVIATTLAENGVEIVFGLPGGESIDLVAALEWAGIRFVLARHEARAAWIADAYARVGRRIGVCLATLGPGAANLAAGLSHCYLDRAPVLALTAQLEPALMAYHSHQRLDLRRLMAPVTKGSWPIAVEDDVARLVREAMTLARSGRFGPVHLELPASVAQSPAMPGSPAEEATRPLAVSEEVIREAAEMLRTARRPAIVVGLGIEPSAPYTPLRRLAEALHAPVVVTPKAKGAIPKDHSLYAGVLGLERREAPADLLRLADCILAVGFDPVELVMPWDFEAPLIFAAEFPNEDPQLPAEIELIGDLGATLEALAAEPYGRSDWTPEEIARARPSWPEHDAGDGLFPSQLLRAVREVLPEDGIVTCDVGSHKLLIGKLWPARAPNRFLVSNGLSIMGYALPAAIGAKLAEPSAPVVCFIGDGGMGMVASEMETAARLGLPIVVIVLADQAMSLIRLKQELAGYEPVGTLFSPVDWCAVARGYGARAAVACTVDEVRAAVQEGLSAGEPMVIEARIDPSEYRSY
ncbi:MAG TPA: thiamine pyrophosphate-binding protein [Caldilineae bacterium]|nr:thiamine pyrophosphate-binding protein [Caldilineae bacterium]